MATLESLIKAEPVSPPKPTDVHSLPSTSPPLLKPDDIKQEHGSPAVHDRRSTAYECAGCKKIISDRYLLNAVDQFWHEDCLKCSCCDSRLTDQGSSLFQKDNMLLCKRDYLRLYGASGYCSLCSQSIPANDFVMKASDKVFHLDCFKCQQCTYKFNRGDRFSLSDKLLCESCLHDARNNYQQEPELPQELNSHKQQIFQNILTRHSSHAHHSQMQTSTTTHPNQMQSPNTTHRRQMQTSTTNSRILDLLQSLGSTHKAS